MGVILHVGEKSRQDWSYVAMCLSGYNKNCPSLETYKILYQFICYLYHHPHVPIMFSCKPPNMETPMKSYFGKGETELANFGYSTYSGLEAWVDLGFAHDVMSRRSTYSIYHKYGDVAFVWLDMLDWCCAATWIIYDFFLGVMFMGVNPRCLRWMQQSMTCEFVGWASS